MDLKWNPEGGERFGWMRRAVEDCSNGACRVAFPMGYVISSEITLPSPIPRQFRA